MEFRFQLLRDAPEPSPRHDLVEGLIAQGDLVLLTGPPGTGKTAIAVLLAASISNGEPFLCRKVEPRDVVYIAAEKRNSVHRRLLAAECDNSRTWFLGCILEIVPSVDALVRGLKQTKSQPGLIVIDTFARITAGLDENSARDMGIVMNALDRLAQELPDAAVLIVHHTGKSGDSARGSSAILAAVDLELKAKGTKNDRYLEVVKANDIEEGQRLQYRLLPVGEGGSIVLAVGREERPRVHEMNEQRARDADERANSIALAMPRDRAIEPPRVLRRLFGLSHAAMAGSSSAA